MLRRKLLPKMTAYVKSMLHEGSGTRIRERESIRCSIVLQPPTRRNVPQRLIA